jgi:hypothetical protein
VPGSGKFPEGLLRKNRLVRARVKMPVYLGNEKGSVKVRVRRPVPYLNSMPRE